MILFVDIMINECISSRIHHFFIKMAILHKFLPFPIYQPPHTHQRNCSVRGNAQQVCNHFDTPTLTHTKKVTCKNQPNKLKMHYEIQHLARPETQVHKDCGLAIVSTISSFPISSNNVLLITATHLWFNWASSINFDVSNQNIFPR